LGFSKPPSSLERPVAPSCIWSDAFVYESVQAVRLAGDAAQRSKLLELLSTNALLRPWWQQYQAGKRTKRPWTVEQNQLTGDHELHITCASAGDADGDRDELTKAEGLVGILVAATRTFLKRHFRVDLRCARTTVAHKDIPADLIREKGNPRYKYLTLDRKHWDRWAVSVFRQPPQNAAASM